MNFGNFTRFFYHPLPGISCAISIMAVGISMAFRCLVVPLNLGISIVILDMFIMSSRTSSSRAVNIVYFHFFTKI